MHKFTVFTVILSIITISVVVDIVVNGYSISDDYIPEASEVEVIDSSDLADRLTNGVVEEIAVKAEEKIVLEPEIEVEKTDEENTNSKITKELLQAIGAEKGIVKNSPEKPYLQAIELEENVKNSLEIVNLFDFEEYLGTMYELNFETKVEAEQLYSDLKTQSIAVEGASIRETDSFGEQSFYFNQEGKTKTAFVTLRIGANIYGFEYPHKSHQFFKDLGKELKK
ncbi:hypothetical protein HOG48_04505 [Candidatus Peregrinibacteria bacterium]|jgi:hypothetical protein|nr:hypothetical protein [Candidatus Peregrinibacteria bacterium]